MHVQPLRILITLRELAVRAGTQLYSLDLVEELRRRGHRPMVYTSAAGAVAEDVRRAGAPVVTDLASLTVAPDVIHGQHHLEAMAAMSRFPRVPAIFVCHGWLPWVEAPPRFPTLARYVAVDELRRERLVVEHGIPAERVAVVPNFVDLERFRPRGPLPASPRRALLLSNQASADILTPVVAAACAAHDIALDVAGVGVHRPLERPWAALAAYDLVFARGRAALEAMAVGTAVVLCDVEGDGPLVTPDRFTALRDLNFGIGALRSPPAAERLRAEIARYDPTAAAAVGARVRQEAGREAAVDRLLELYGQAIDEAAGTPGSDDEALAAAARYLAWLAPTVLERERERAETWETLQAAKARAADSEAHRQRLESSPLFRLRRWLLGVPGLPAAYRRLRRI